MLLLGSFIDLSIWKERSEVIQIFSICQHSNFLCFFMLDVEGNQIIFFTLYIFNVYIHVCQFYTQTEHFITQSFTFLLNVLKENILARFIAMWRLLLLFLKFYLDFNILSTWEASSLCRKDYMMYVCVKMISSALITLYDMKYWSVMIVFMWKLINILDIID